MNHQTILEKKEYFCENPESTFELGERFGETLTGGEVILLEGGLGAGKTLFTKGILFALDFDVDEVTSPSFTLVNRYDAKFTVYHLDLWRIEGNAAFAVGLDELLEEKNAIIIIEWSEKLGNFSFPNQVIRIKIEGDGDSPRKISFS